MPDATDNRVLSQLMLLQGTLDSMPTDESMSRFVVRGLKSVPGVKSLNVCIRGAVAEKNDLCTSCNSHWVKTEDNFDYSCKLEDHGHTRCLPIRTVDRLYGFVVFSLNDPPDAFTPYEPYLQNIVTVIALSIDNRRQKQVLDVFNKQLQEEVEHRKQMEEALRHENIFIEALFESVPGMLYVYDDQGTHIRHNKKHEEMTGYSEEELSHLNPLSWYDDKADIVRVEAAINDVFTIGYGEVEAPMRIKNGEKLLMHFTGSRLIMDGKKYFVGVGTDITARKQAQEALQESQAELQAIFETVGTGILIIDKDTQNIIEANKAAIEMTGLPKEKITGQICHSLVCPAQAGKCPVKDLGQSVDHSERKLLCAEGHVKDILKTVHPITIKGRDCYLESFIDITDRKQAERALQESEELFRSYLEHAPDGIYMSDLEGTFLYGNSKCEEMIGYRREELIGKNLLELNILPGKYLDKAAQLLQANIEGKSTGPDEFDLITKEGRLIPVEINTGVVQRMGQVIVLASVRDITERRLAEEKIQQMAYHDSLTGLPNRKLFSDRLVIALAHAQRNQKGVAVAMLDLDKFKNVNDTLGHDVGDLLLKAAAERLSAELRKGDTVARFGGDEFVLILPDLKGIEDVIQVAQKIVDSFRKPFLIDTHQLLVTTSMGIAVYPHDGTDESILLKNADITMYQVKQTGRDRYQLYKKA